MSETITDITELIKTSRHWYHKSNRWKNLHWAIGILGIIMSCIAAGKFEPYSQYCPIIAAIFFGVVGFSNPQRQAMRYRKGFIILNPAILKYHANLISLKELYALYERALGYVNDEVESKPLTLIETNGPLSNSDNHQPLDKKVVHH